ncbi:DUF1190 domain-containing protein [Hyphomicrobium zavarzinii]|jgi:hypothetical protein|uniref:DUF1190 domain-containing protein n=2 Tax=Hyphomicrobium TaxID=81 RepID=UPI0009FE2E8A|nr:DUF1190 domain-containing protein [Hyphomicrobium zavarzinii]
MACRLLAGSCKPMRTLVFARVIALFGFAALLGGCGNANTTSADAPQSPAMRGVIASASDCVSFGQEAVTACAAAIERAVTRHEASSQTYSNIEACEKAVGANKCERAASGKYRQKLSAFMVSLGSSPRAEPLYPAKDGAVGFQSSDKSTYLASDQSVTFSRLALSVAEMQASPKKGGRRPSL